MAPPPDPAPLREQIAAAIIQQGRPFAQWISTKETALELADAILPLVTRERERLTIEVEARERQVGAVVGVVSLTDVGDLARAIYDRLPEGEGAKSWEDAGEDNRAFLIGIATAAVEELKDRIAKRGGMAKFREQARAAALRVRPEAQR